MHSRQPGPIAAMRREETRKDQRQAEALRENLRRRKAQARARARAADAERSARPEEPACAGLSGAEVSPKSNRND